jgi:uncharacterized protein
VTTSLVDASVGFAEALRRAGLSVGVADTLDFVRALELLDVGRRADVRAASRAIFVRRHEDAARHDATFNAYWRTRRDPGRTVAESAGAHGRTSSRDERAGGHESTASPRSHGSLSSSAAGESGESDGSFSRATYSAEEVLRARQFERMTSVELRQAEAAIAALAVTIERARTRRNEIDAHGTQFAPRLTMRRSLATGGELVDWVFRRPRLAPRPVTLLIDVSGSMELHARLMLRFAHVLRRIDRHTEVFVFGTRLTRVTRQLSTRDVDRALTAVASEVHDWSGGTRIGDSFRTFNRTWVRRTGAADGIVVVLSDGWDRGDPALTAQETQRLRRNCRRLVWLNPLAGAPGYEPLAGGMAAAIRNVDVLLPAATLNDLDALAQLLADTRWGQRERLPRAIRSAGDPRQMVNSIKSGPAFTTHY